MIEDLVKDYLQEKLGIPTYMEIPKDPPARYIVIERTGQTRTNFIYESILAVQDYCKSLYEAAQLNHLINNTMLDELVKEKEISSVQMNGSTNFTDPSKKQPRYQSVFAIKHY